jgi:hypothetical protein
VKVALENWKVDHAAAKTEGGNVPPIETYLFHAMRIVESIDGSVSTPDEIRTRMSQALQLSDAASSMARKQ